MLKSGSAALLMLSGCSSLLSLTTQPWLGDVYSLQLDTQFAYTQFSKVQGAVQQPSSMVHDYDLRLDLESTPYACLAIQGEIELAQTTGIGWGFRSGALQVRYAWLNDIAGDPLSVVFGASGRGVPSHFLHTVATPYAAQFDAELTCTVGKEWAQGADWVTHLYGTVAVGQANRGSPWTREKIVGEYNYHNQHRFLLSAEGIVGFGTRRHVDAKRFRGWAPYQYRALDLGFAYGYKLGVYGVISLGYEYRVFAHEFPEKVQRALLCYKVPLSIF